MLVEPGSLAVSTPVVVLGDITVKSVLKKLIAPTVAVTSQGTACEQPGAVVLYAVAE